MKETIVLYPAPAFHHIVSMVEVGKLILQHHPNFSLTILVGTMPSDTPTANSYIDNISKTNLPISFLSLPSIPAASAFEFMRLIVPHALDALRTLYLSSSVLALVTSGFLFSDYDLNVPIYFYFSSCAASLSTLLYLPTIHNQTTESFKDLNDTFFHIPGLPPIKASLMPQPLLQRDDPVYQYFLDFASFLPKSKGIIINTFDSLEPRAIGAIADGACVPNGVTPAIYSIGPLITDAKDRAGASNESLAWLDAQPNRSVVFLCFGSKGTFSEVQIEKIAYGLERSNQRFLWVVKSPKGPTTEPNLEELLPKGFLERTKERGFVVKSWAPQNAILRHESVGGFVTHCGWNSVLEAVSYGVPMVAWPLYAEQHLNATVLVEEMKLALPIHMATSSKGSGEEEGIATAEEVEKSLRELMELEEGKVLRKRSLEIRAMAMAAWTTGGSSFTAFQSWRLLGSKDSTDIILTCGFWTCSLILLL